MAGDGTQTSAFARTIGYGKGGKVYTSIAGVDISKLDSAKDFIAKYSATYGANNIGSYSGPAYDCTKILIGAIKTALAKGVKTPASSSDAAQAKVFRQAVIDAIQGTSYDGVTGHHTFDQNGDTTNRAISIYDIAPDVNKGDGWEVLTIVKIGS
jgi:branched-chain amino acid transport system substrate-binding protein